MNIDSVLKRFADYQRPGRQLIWVILIAAGFIMIITGHPIKDESGLGIVMLTGMFADMGIYSIARTIEKNTVVNSQAGPANTTTVNNIKTDQLNQNSPS